jgi:hypothetical protein
MSLIFETLFLLLNEEVGEEIQACLVQSRERGGEVIGGIFKEGRRGKI